MPLLEPLGTPLPLRNNPYNSRVQSQLNVSGSNVKNYYMIAFNPGYALQASELNEIQELFYIHESLTCRMYGNWQDEAYSKIPFWEGLIPLNPNFITILSTPTIIIDPTDGQQAVSFTVSISQGWYLWTDSESKLSFWISNPFNNTITLSVKNNEYIGFEVLKQTINCCQSQPCPEGSDETLRDNSQGSTENWFTCGASRLSAKVLSDSSGTSSFAGNVTVRNTIASNFYPILKVSINNNIPTIMFGDGQEVQQVIIT